MILKDNAIFIADAHYPHYNSKLINLLKKIENSQIEATQLFLMGDIFDLLVGRGKNIYRYNKEAIDIINRISNNIQTIYIEGNHDFYIKNIFPKAIVVSQKEQPLCIYDLQNSLYCLSHGDIYNVSFYYKLYSVFIRNPFTIRALSTFEKLILNKIISDSSKKQICKKIKNFKDIAQDILHYYPPTATVIEGHFHQGIKLQRYISLPSLACDNKYTIFKDKKFIFVTNS